MTIVPFQSMDFLSAHGIPYDDRSIRFLWYLRAQNA